jgi:hypothetical protein
MAGIGQPDVEPLSGGAAAQPLVSPMQPVLTPNAVQQLVDAVHNGAINTIDIANRIGAVAQAEKKANLEKLGEYVSPEAIQSRMSQLRAQGQQAQLTGAQAEAAQGLVQPATESQLQDIIQKNETRYSAPAVSAYTQFNPPIYKVDENGNPTKEYDVQAMSREGSRYVRAQSMLALAADGLKATPTQMKNPKTGAPVTVWLNAKGEDVTPVAGNKSYEFYNQMRRDAYEVFHEKPDTTPHVEPVKNAEGINILPKDNPPAGMITGPDQEAVPAPGVTPQASQGAAAADPTLTQPAIVATSEQPTVAPDYMPYQGMQVGPVQTPPEATKAFEEKPDVKAFYTSLPVYTGFADASRQSIQQPSSVSDLALAESYSKLFDPQSTLREFKFDALQKAIPWLSKFKDALPIIEREHMFPDNVRKAIARSGLDVINSREKALVPRLQEAQAEGALLDPEQRKILAGIPFSSRAGLDPMLAGAPGSAPGLTTLPSGRRVRFVPGP